MPMTELELIRQAQAGSVKATNKLCRMHTGFVVSCASKFSIKDLDHDDIVQLCYLGLLDAIRDYKEEMGFKLISYAAYKIRGKIHREYTGKMKLKRCAPVCSLDANRNVSGSNGKDGYFDLSELITVEHEFYNEDSLEMLEKCIELVNVTEIKKKVMRELFNSVKYELNYTLKDIGEKVSLTRERVRQIIEEMRREPHFQRLKRELVELTTA
jgi:RNA polymerase sigma factor (sigma-70 family)